MRIRSLSPLIMAGLLASCATPSVTLLTSEEGRQGAVALLEEDGKPVESEISELNSRTNLSGKPRSRSIDPAKLSARKRTLLSELPPPPMRQTLYFKEGTTELMPESEPGLAYLKAEVAQRPGAEVQVTGYTDTLGSSEDNDLLSQQRAEEVLAALAQQGIDKGLMSAVGRGERELREETPDGVANPVNRRVVVIVR